MLILSRESGQKILIGNEIEVVVRHGKGKEIKVGIKAPKHLEIWREELAEKIMNRLSIEKEDEKQKGDCGDER